MEMMTRYLPILDWGRRYRADQLGDDLLAALIVTIMLIPQSLAYALLAGLPAEVGLYASILPLLAYGLFGTSRALAVGPVAVVSLMTAAAIGNLGPLDMETKIVAAMSLALISGVMLTLMGVIRLGFLANFLSHPVISGFITASGLIIAASQVKHILGVDASGHNLLEVLFALSQHLGDANVITMILGVSATIFLFWNRQHSSPLLQKLGMGAKLADVFTKAGPVAAVAATTLAVYLLNLDGQGVAIVGQVPQGIPALQLAVPPGDMLVQLMLPAFLISVVGFVESVSVAQTLAAKKREQIKPDQELIALGASNIFSSVGGGYPVTGGFARSVVNFDAGAATPAAGMFTAIGIAMATLFLTPLLYFLPKATLAATIIVAVLSLVDFKSLGRAWRYSKADFAAQAGTIILTLMVGVEAGIIAGVLIGIFLVLYRMSAPHAAVVGLVPGTQHYRNILRHHVITSPHIWSLRIDENLVFANARRLEELVLGAVADHQQITDVVLMCPAVSFIDFSALEALEELNHRLEDAGVRLHLSEVKGPVMDQLQRSDFLHGLTGDIFLSHHEAMLALDPERFGKES